MDLSKEQIGRMAELENLVSELERGIEECRREIANIGGDSIDVLKLPDRVHRVLIEAGIKTTKHAIWLISDPSHTLRVRRFGELSQKLLELALLEAGYITL